MPGMAFELQPQKIPFAITGNIPYLAIKKVLLQND